MLDTQRLRLRQWQDSDLPAFAALNADAEVMRHFPKCLSRAESDAGALRARQHIEEYGWGFCACELKSTGEFIGFVGITHIKPHLPCAPGVEIGWRLARHFWRQGYAAEAALACLHFAFQQLQLAEVLAFTTRCNLASQGVMTKIGMHNTGRDFLHPDLPTDSPLQHHLLYAINASPGRVESVS